jgi:hypothetical protein
MNFSIDPKISFYVGVALTIATVVGSSPDLLHNAFPETWIPSMVAWNNLIAKVGLALSTFAAGVSAKNSGPLTK